MRASSLKGVANCLAFLVGLLLSPSAFSVGGKVQAVTDAHRAITQEKTWLNTSRALKAEDLAGRILLVDFWTFCCINCIHVIPDLKKLEAEFKDDLTVIGVHSAKFDNEKDTQSIRSAILRYEIEHAVVNDANFKIWQSFGVRAWPTLVLINPDGQIEKAFSGEGHLEALRKEITKLRIRYEGKLNQAKLPYRLESAKLPQSLLRFPSKLAYAEDQGLLFISDSNNNRIVALRLKGDAEAEAAFLVGDGKMGRLDGDFGQARFDHPQGILYRKGLLYVADTENHLLRLVDLKTRKVSTLAGTGKQGFDRSVENLSALKTPLSSPWDLTVFGQDEILIAMAGTHQLWVYNTTKQTVRVVAGNGRESIDDGAYPENSLSQPSGVSAHEGRVYFVDSETSSLRVLEKGKVTTLLGTGLFDFGFKDGKQGEALLQHPLGLTAGADAVFIADSYNHAVRRYDVLARKIVTVTGTNVSGYRDGSLKEARFHEPAGLVLVGSKLYVADTNNHLIRVVDPLKGHVRTLEIHFEATKSERPELSKFLPHLKPSQEQLKVQAKAQVKVKLVFQGQKKLNDKAPSWLALFEKTAEGKFQHIKSYRRDDFKNKNTVELPALKPSLQYRLQGTFYYCEPGRESLCFIQSHDQLFAPANQGSSEIVFQLE
ncbi:MAG: thioredoxin-like domain-containing protein [Bdellovibrionota bacterium]